MGRSNPSGHPARFSDSIVQYLKTVLEEGEHVHDPFAGTGEFLGQLADEIGFRFTGTEIEQSFIVDPRVKVGDSTLAETYPRRYSWVGCTSVVYPNGVADNFATSDKEKKVWKRNTYRHSIVRATNGEQTELTPNNMGAFGYRGTKREGRSLKRQAYWDLAERCVVHWGGARKFFLNVSDFVSGDDIEPVTDDWRKLFENHGWTVIDVEHIPTPRYLNASDASRDQRMDAETVLTLIPWRMVEGSPE